MRTDEELATAYADLLDGDEIDLLPMVRDLERVLAVRRPPESLTLAFNQTLAERIECRSAPRRPFIHRLIPFGAATSSLPRQVLGLAVLLLLTVALVGSVAYAASTFIRVQPPEHPNAGGWTGVIGDFFPPSGYAQYRPIGPRRAARESGSALAYLQEPPAGSIVSVWIPVARPLKVPTPRPAPGNEGLSMAIRSVVRYRQGNHTVLVALDQPSQRLAAKPLLLGERTVRLPNGHLAWETLMSGSEESNMVATVSGDYVVVLAGDLPMQTIERLATETVVIPPSAKPAARHIPANWPPPLPPQSPPAGTHIRLQASEVHESETNDRLTLTFMFSIGNFGAATARDINTIIELPPVLAQHAIDTLPPWHFDKFNTESEGGFGGDVRVNVAGISRAAVHAALAKGIEVRVTWLDAGKRRAHVYRFPVR